MMNGGQASAKREKRVLFMHMGWCLDCHSQQPNADQLRECDVCHK
jgi:hypothetical protein